MGNETLGYREAYNTWHGYYDLHSIPHTFASQLRVYQKMTSRLVEKDNIHDPQGFYVLGGFFPDHDNIIAFHNLVRDVNPRCNLAQIRYLDKNPEPASILGEEERSRFQQLDLSQIGQIFPANSIELLVLDHTVQFINDQDLSDMLSGLSHALSLSGLALMTKIDSLIPFFERFALARCMPVPVYPRRDKPFQAQLETHLKVVEIGDYHLKAFNTARIYSVARKDSPYQCFAGKGALLFD